MHFTLSLLVGLVLLGSSSRSVAVDPTVARTLERVPEEKIEAAAVALEKAPAAQRDAALEALTELGRDAEPRLVAALDRRLANAALSLTSGNTLTQLGQLADARKVLDQKRKQALDLIFDEERYFYPYRPPECPPEKGKLYPGVQQEVDDLVAEVAVAWKHARRASLPTQFRSALAELDWNRSARLSRKLAFALPAKLPEWIDGVGRDLEVVDLRSFGWDAKERDALTRDRQVEERNERLWRKKDKTQDPAAIASEDEQRQVSVTNEYRRMFGRCALAWDARLQLAAQGHSDWMSLTGVFSHFETDPTRKTPADRMRLAGYKASGGENCSMGDSGPEGAHMGLTSSSGHHRNILTPTHREMASALQGNFWTQNFGAGRDFERDLSPK